MKTAAVVSLENAYIFVILKFDYVNIEILKIFNIINSSFFSVRRIEEPRISSAGKILQNETTALILFVVTICLKNGRYN